MDNIGHAFGDVESRLLDHRPVIQGEVRYFVKEFEEKRGLRECRLLENLNKMVAENVEQALPRCIKSFQKNLFDTVTGLEAVNHMTQRIQQRELEALHRTHLQEGTEQRRKDWEEFLKEQTRLREEMDEKHVEAVGKLSAQYNEMKRDLSKLSHF